MTPNYTIHIDGEPYQVIWFAETDRCICLYQGLYVLADWVMGPQRGPDSVWELSGRPADARERAELERLTASMNDVSVVTVLEKP
jgi:hypothetical protein